MPRASGGLNREVGRIVTDVLGEMSLEQAAIHVDYKLSRTPLGDLKKGKVGWEATLRTFAEGFWQRICELYGAEVTARFGECTRETASDWLAEKAGFGLRYASPTVQPGGADVADETPLTVDMVRQVAAEAAVRAVEEHAARELTYGQVIKQELDAMKERLSAEGLAEFVPERGSGEGGSKGLSAEDARAEVAELERVLRKHFGKG